MIFVYCRDHSPPPAFIAKVNDKYYGYGMNNCLFPFRVMAAIWVILFMSTAILPADSPRLVADEVLRFIYPAIRKGDPCTILKTESGRQHELKFHDLKKWRYQKDCYVLYLTAREQGSSPSITTHHYEMIYVVRKTTKGFKILAAYHNYGGLANLLDDCADCFIRLDLAAYRVKDHTYAIGIRYGCPVVGGTNLFDEGLTLYIMENKSLKPILDDDMGYICRFGESKSVLIILKTQRDGFYDILKKSSFYNLEEKLVSEKKEVYKWNAGYGMYLR